MFTLFSTVVPSITTVNKYRCSCKFSTQHSISFQDPPTTRSCRISICRRTGLRLLDCWCRKVAADGSLLRKCDGDRLFVSAYFGRESTHEMNDNLSAGLRELHVQTIRTFFWCHHWNTPVSEFKEPLSRSCSRQPPRRGSTAGAAQ